MAVTSYARKCHLEAGTWLARLHAADLSAEDEAKFQLWLAADSAHAMAFEDATNIWDRLGAIPREFYVLEQDVKINLSRRMVLVAAAGAAVFGASIPFPPSAHARTYQTAVGEQTRFPLTDSGSLFLDTNTCLSVDWSGDRCLADLKYGRVNCRVTGSAYPFTVQVMDHFVVGAHCVFDVLKHSTRISVTLINGDAEVKSPGNSSIRLRPGDRISSSNGKHLFRDRPNLALLAAWQTGRLVFRDETVSSAVEEVNRYSTTKIEIDDPDISSLRISGGYIIGDPLGFADSLSQLLPVQVRQAAGKIELIPRREI